MTGPSLPHTGVGAPVRRVEDRRLITGKGQFVDDLTLPGMAFAAFVRSPHGHAEIGAIDGAAALALPGVLAVLTGAELAADGVLPLSHNTDWTGPPDAELALKDGFAVYAPPHIALPQDRARFVGEAVAMVIADTAAAAADGAERVTVDYRPLPAVADARAALAADAPVVWPDRPGNISLDCTVGDAAAADAAFARAAHVVAFESWVQRIAGAPLEPRAVIGSYDAALGRYELRAASGRGVVQTQARIAAALGVDLASVRVVFGDMGGNFGTRNAMNPELLLLPWAARRMGRPVKWTANRSECFLTDYQGRDLAVKAELALDRDGRFLALRGENIQNLGAYAAYFWPLRKGLSMMQSVYTIPAVAFSGKAVFTNLPPTAVYRSAGRPEAIYVMERLIDIAAVDCGFDRVDLRRLNLIAKDALPFKTAVGVTYDSGDYAAAMEQALAAADWAGFAERRAASARAGLCRGIGIANYIEVTSGIPRERAELRVDPGGHIDLVVGTMSSGQGHETSFAQVASDWLGVPFDSIRFVANTTDRVSVGGGSHSGRSMRLITIAIRDAIADLTAKGQAISGHVLGAAPASIAYRDGRFVTADGRSLSIFDVAHAAMTLNSLPEPLRAPFEGIGDITDRSGGYPYGAHVCEVEVDPETGQVKLVAWTGVDDVGLAINPMILHGQAHGAIAQGAGQALLETLTYEAGTAQLLSGSFMDYAMPRADMLPALKTLISEVPASSHPFGVRPGGEGGTTPALGLVINAIVDALAGYGVRHIEMPATPERVWRAIAAAQA